MAAAAMKRIEEIDKELSLLQCCRDEVARVRESQLFIERTKVQVALQIMLSPALDFDSSTVH